MIAATVASTSAETSRLDVSKTSKAASNPSALMSSQAGIPISCDKRSAHALGRLVVAEADFGLAARPDVAQLSLEALDFEPHGGAAEKGQGDDSRRRIGLLEADRQQIERRRPALGVEADVRNFEHPVEPQRRADALMAPARRRAPVVTHGRQNEALLRRQIGELRALHAGILHMRRDEERSSSSRAISLSAVSVSDMA